MPHKSKPRRRRRMPYRGGYDRHLARLLVLEDGTRLRTLKDAADVLANMRNTVRGWGALERAIELLMVAAQSGTRDDLVAATDQIQIVLRG
jgi:hypothetical protein